MLFVFKWGRQTDTELNTLKQVSLAQAYWILYVETLKMESSISQTYFIVESFL